MRITEEGFKEQARVARDALLARCRQNEAWIGEIPEHATLSRWLAIPTRYRPLWLRLTNGQGTPRQAIKAQCLECQGFEREAVKTCESFACPLWHLRPK